jgi:CheY-like chemotaxis protein
VILERMGHCVRATGDGIEALHWLAAEPYDLFIVDVKMPEIDGPTLYLEVLARRPTGGPRVLVISGFAEPPDYENVPESRDVPLLIKPFTIIELKAALDRVLVTVSAPSADLDLGRRR